MNYNKLPKENGKHIRLNEHLMKIEKHLTKDNLNYNYITEVTQKMACQIVDMQDKILCDTIIAFAKEQGVTDLFLLDEEFVKSALINEAKRRQGVTYEKNK